MPAKGTCKNQIVNQNYRDQLFEIEATSWEQVWCAQLSERNGKKKKPINYGWLRLSSHLSTH